jgi:hypothetical protein
VSIHSRGPTPSVVSIIKTSRPWRSSAIIGPAVRHRRLGNALQLGQLDVQLHVHGHAVAGCGRPAVLDLQIRQENWWFLWLLPVDSDLTSLFLWRCTTTVQSSVVAVGFKIFYVFSPTLLVSSSPGTNKWNPYLHNMLAGTIRQFSCIRKQILFGGRRLIEKQILYRYEVRWWLL